MNIRKILIIISTIIILVLFVIVASVSYNTGMNYGVNNAETIRIQKTKKSKIHEKAIKSVLVTKVRNTQINTQINSTGRVTSLNNITISSEVQGRLVGNNNFKKGTQINKGEIIFSVKDSDLKLLIKSKKSRFMSLISTNISDIELDFNSEYNKWNNFFNSIDLSKPLPDFPQMNTAKEKNYIISRSILSEYLSIQSDEEKLSKYTVLAPFNGIITKSYSDVGGNVNPGSPVVDFIRNGGMEIELTVNTSEIEFITIGDKVDLWDNHKKYSGQITRKGGFVNTSTQNISVFASVKTSEEDIYSGMYLDAKINTQAKENVFEIPRRAIFDNNKIFTIQNDNKLKIKKISILGYQEDNVIIDNLKDNMLIVIEPLISVNEGAIVKPILK